MPPLTSTRVLLVVGRGANVSQYDVVNAEDKLALNNWVYEHLRAELEVCRCHGVSAWLALCLRSCVRDGWGSW